MKAEIKSAHDLQILRNVIGLLPKTYRNRNTNAVIVSDILLVGTDHSGSTSSHNKCIELGINPGGYLLPTFKEIREFIFNEPNK